MRRTQLAILVLLVVVLGVAAWLLARRSTTSWQSNTGHLPDKVITLPIDQVAEVTIQQPKAQLHLKQQGDTWVVAEKANYPANFQLVSTLIRKAWELKPVQEVKVGKSQLGRLSLLHPGGAGDSGTLVEFKDAAGKPLAGIVFGKQYLRESAQTVAQGRPFPAGRYVMPEDSSGRVLLVSDAFQQIDNKPEQWLDRAFIKIEKPISVTMAGRTPEMNWKLERAESSTEWKLADAKPGEQLDPTKAAQVTSALSSISSFSDVLPPDAKPETTGLDKPAVVTVTTQDGFTYTLKVGKKTGEAYALAVAVTADLAKSRTPAKDEKPEDKARLDKEFQTKHETLEKKLTGEKKFEGRIFLVSKYGVEQLEKNRADLLAPKLTPTPSLSPAEKARP
jgi:Domain of unknown function (DUF4340)